jgi:hypothetical protein
MITVHYLQWIPPYAFKAYCIIKQRRAATLPLPVCCVSVWSVALDLKGPQFLQQPPHRVKFSNSSRGRVDCSAHGNPAPQLAWSLGDGAALVQIADLRLVHTNGSLVFPPFPAEHYCHDIHTALNPCKAQNQTGHMPTCGPVSSYGATLFHTNDSVCDLLQFAYCLLYREK